MDTLGDLKVLNLSKGEIFASFSKKEPLKFRATWYKKVKYANVCFVNKRYLQFPLLLKKFQYVRVRKRKTFNIQIAYFLTNIIVIRTAQNHFVCNKLKWFFWGKGSLYLNWFLCIEITLIQRTLYWHFCHTEWSKYSYAG